MRVCVRVEKDGTILIPAEVRKLLNIPEGESDVVLEIDKFAQSISLERWDQSLARIRERLAKYIPEGTLLSEELLADRRREAEGE